jgi:hypothetical protein
MAGDGAFLGIGTAIDITPRRWKSGFGGREAVPNAMVMLDSLEPSCW